MIGLKKYKLNNVERSGVLCHSLNLIENVAAESFLETTAFIDIVQGLYVTG